MTSRRFALFDTAIGRCAVVWGAGGVAAVQLPEESDGATRARLAQRFAGASEAAPSPAVRRAIDDIGALLRGEARDLSRIELDMAGVPEFHRRVYEVARAIPPGATLSYGEIATRLGSPGSARAVGQALGRNPFALVVPCHRVLAAGGKVGGFSAAGGAATKRRLLAIEGAAARETLPLFQDGDALGFDLEAAVDHLRAADPVLGRLIDAVGPCRLELAKAPTLFFALARAIVHQQLATRVAQTIFGRVQALAPRSRTDLRPEHVLRLSDEKLRGAGLSAAKLLALRDLAAKAAGGELPTFAEIRRMDDEEIVQRLTRVRGIGRWTVQMLLIFHLGRADVLPADDFGVRQGFALAFRKRELPARAELEKRGARWAPYRTVASWYLWRAVERARAGAARP